MRLITFSSDTGPRIAAVVGEKYVDLNQADAAIPADPIEFLAGGSEVLAKAQAAAESGAGESRPANVLAPIPNPGKIICIGLNYADHAAESGAEIPSEPVTFCKFGTAVAADREAVLLPKLSEKVDYEAELVVVIGKQGRHIPQTEAMSYVGGYTCGHDVSARDWQIGKPGGQWLLGKTFDGFAPFGPVLVTPDEVPNPGELRIALRLNGETMQDSNTRQLIFPIDHLISYLSGVVTLEPGDVLFTGTPPGVGAARKPPVFIQDGDVAEVEIEGIGILTNSFVAE